MKIKIYKKNLNYRNVVSMEYPQQKEIQVLANLCASFK